MKKDTIVFVATKEYDNLGVGYMASLLSEAGFKTKIIDFRTRRSVLLKVLKELDPLLIGFSIIFLNYINRFTELIKYLRENEVNCHFTAGGHFASLKYEELFSIVPQLNSIIRFDGEYPMLELSKRLSMEIDWTNIESLVYKENDKIIANPLSDMEKDLDRFPYPTRSILREYAFTKKFTTILAGRGCVHNCSFCNTREFYRQSNGPIKRIRRPGEVAEEMRYLFIKKKCSVFLFHDDDFPIKPHSNPVWAKEFCSELKRNGLNEKILWKINCRPDDVEEEIFSIMKRNGLFLVFIGLEDGTNAGLERLNKQIGPETGIKAIKALKSLRIGFDYGFMLFQPETTFRSLNENLRFLRFVCGDGYTPATFLKLIPFYETKVEKELKESGRLIYTDGTPDYHFHEEALDHYYGFVSSCFYEWSRSSEGFENISKWARNYCLVYHHYYSDKKGSGICKKITSVISEANLFMLDIMEELAEIYESEQYKSDLRIIEVYREKIKISHNRFRDAIITTMAKLISHVSDL